MSDLSARFRFSGDKTGLARLVYGSMVLVTVNIRECHNLAF